MGDWSTSTTSAMYSPPVTRLNPVAAGPGPAVMPFSARARDGAPVAAPVAWEELDRFKGGNHFTIRDADELLERASSRQLAGWGQAKQALPDA